MRRRSQRHPGALPFFVLLLASTLFLIPSAQAVDTTPPSAVTDLRVVSVNQTSVSLEWTAPSDPDNPVAKWYDVRYATSGPLSESNFYSGTYYTSPFPSPPGTTESFTLTGLQTGVTYWFAIKSSDDVPNWSGASNSPSATPGTAANPPVVPSRFPWDVVLMFAILAGGLGVALAVVVRRRRAGEGAPPTAATDVSTELRPGRAYLVEGPRPGRSLSLLEGADGGGRPVLAISRADLDFDRVGRDPSNLRHYRLVDRGSPRAEGLLPPSLERTGLLVEEFLAAEPRGTVFLEGIEFLSDNNNFAGVLRLVRLIVDRIVRTDHVLLVSVAPGILALEDLRRLETEMEVLTPPAS